jgi:hypothetical protein
VTKRLCVHALDGAEGRECSGCPDHSENACVQSSGGHRSPTHSCDVVTIDFTDAFGLRRGLLSVLHHLKRRTVFVLTAPTIMGVILDAELRFARDTLVGRCEAALKEEMEDSDEEEEEDSEWNTRIRLQAHAKEVMGNFDKDDLFRIHSAGHYECVSTNIERTNDEADTQKFHIIHEKGDRMHEIGLCYTPVLDIHYWLVFLTPDGVHNIVKEAPKLEDLGPHVNFKYSLLQPGQSVYSNLVACIDLDKKSSTAQTTPEFPLASYLVALTQGADSEGQRMYSVVDYDEGSDRNCPAIAWCFLAANRKNEVTLLLEPEMRGHTSSRRWTLPLRAQVVLAEAELRREQQVQDFQGTPGLASKSIMLATYLRASDAAFARDLRHMMSKGYSQVASVINWFDFMSSDVRAAYEKKDMKKPLQVKGRSVKLSVDVKKDEVIQLIECKLISHEEAVGGGGGVCFHPAHDYHLRFVLNPQKEGDIMKLLLEKADSATRVRHNVTVGVSDLEVEGKPMLVLCLKATRDIKEGTCLSIDIAAHTTAVAPRGDVPDAARGKRIAAFPGLHLEFEMGSNKRVRRAIAKAPVLALA